MYVLFVCIYIKRVCIYNKSALIPTNQDESNIYINVCVCVCVCVYAYIYIYIYIYDIYVYIYIYFLGTTFSIQFYDFAKHFESISFPVFPL